jgi:LDH2 family malate/lactate/ureidoglycolate dehydrogenase
LKEKLWGWTQEVLQKIGVSGEDATLLTDSLIEANLRGVDRAN